MTDPGQRRLDAQTVEVLYRDHSSRLRGFLVGLLRNTDLAEEALQNTFAQALKSGADVDPGAMKAWLFRVAHNEAMSLRRRQQIDVQALRQIARTAPQFGLSGHEELLRAEVVEQLQRAIQGLPPDQRTIIEKRRRGAQTFQLIADELGLPLGTVLTRMRLALEKLRAALNGDIESEGDE